MDNETKQDTSSPEKTKSIDPTLERLKFKPLKDILLIAVGGLIILAIVLATVFGRKDSTYSHVEIRYQDTLLWEKDDTKKNTAIAFPSSGEKRVSFSKEDGSIYLGEGKSFAFLGESVTFTLYSDHSIQLLEEDVECPDHTCSHMGRIYNTYTPIVCLPNQIQAMIVADSFPEFDN